MQKRSQSILRAAAAASAILSASMSMAAIYYAPVVEQVGDGGTTALSTAAALTTIQVYADGTANQTAPVASDSYTQDTSSTGLQTTGSSTTEGQISNNPLVATEAATDTAYTGTTAYVYSGGYSAAANNANVVSTTTANPRVVGYMSVTSNSVSGAAVGSNDTSLSTYSGANIRGAAGNDSATGFWAAGSSSGYHYLPPQTSGTSVTFNSSTPSNVRTVALWSNSSGSSQLYGSSDTVVSSVPYVGIQQIGTGLPTTAPQSATVVLNTNSSSSDASPESFVFLDDPSHSTPATDGGVTGFAAVPYNVVYIADAETGTVSSLEGPGIEKWVYETGTNAANGGWSLAYTIADASLVQNTSTLADYATPMQAVAGQEDGNGNVLLYGTTEPFKQGTTAGTTATSTGSNELLEFTDPLDATSAAQAVLTDATEQILATSATNTDFRGVALAPAVSVPEPATFSLLGIGVLGFMKRRRK